jgi:mannose-6-phosphate isomerase-like protein (cupin superfamily)
MPVSDARTLDLAETYVHLEDSGGAEAIETGDSFWQELMAGERRYDGRLVIVSTMTEDMPHWEMHPAGEELVYLLSGAVDVELDDGTDRRIVALRPEAPCLFNPRGLWHRFIVHEPSRLLFVTYGAGTQHRPV